MKLVNAASIWNSSFDASFCWTKVMNGGMCFYMGVSKNKGTQKWMVYNGKPYWHGWFGDTIIFGNTHMFELWYLLAKEQNSIFLQYKFWMKSMIVSDYHVWFCSDMFSGKVWGGFLSLMKLLRWEWILWWKKLRAGFLGDSPAILIYSPCILMEIHSNHLTCIVPDQKHLFHFIRQ